MADEVTPLTPRVRKQQVPRELGSTGLKHWSGIVDEEFLTELKGLRGQKIYTEMRYNDPIIGSIAYAVEMLLRQVDWAVQPASQDGPDIEAADFLHSCMFDMEDTWNEMVTAAISFLWHGFSLHEMVYKVRQGPKPDDRLSSKFTDGRIGWRGLPIRSQESLDHWIFDPNDPDHLLGVNQRPPPTYESINIPMDRLLHFRTTGEKGNPEGRSLIRNAYRPWYFKKRIEEIEGIGIERDLAGLPVAYIPPEILSSNASADQLALRSKLEELIRNIRRNEREGVLFPLVYDEDGNQSYKLELLSTGGRRQFDTSQIINRYDNRIAMTVLADFVLLGHERVGSFALSRSKTNMFTLSLESLLDTIADVLNRQGVPRLFALNDFANISGLPQFKHTDIETVDLDQLSKLIGAMAGAGSMLFPDPTLENWVRDQAGMPQLEDDGTTQL